ncbi:hypothetical protein HBH51_114800 [Parastagonospora nodorum]|nr:hypothetical protein HBH51_114800 [Parastagonospora nodorum]
MEIPTQSEHPQQENVTTMETFQNSETHPAITTTPGSVCNDEATSPSEAPQCPIRELQDALGPLLLSTKKVELQRPEWILTPAKKPPILPKWTGSFTLLAFPRELRDKIYYHYIYRPEGVLFRRNTARCYLFDDRPEDRISLFLTCRQVYDEAWQVFCRYNAVHLPARQDWGNPRTNFKTLDGTLRVFPDKPARSLQRISLSFMQYMFMYRYRTERDQLTAGEAFVQILRDAYTVKFTFPKLRECIVFFDTYHDFFGLDSRTFQIPGADDEEKTQWAFNLMKRFVGPITVVPPSWLVFRFNPDWHYEYFKHQEGIWNAGYQRLVREYADKDEALENSGKKWIEETWEFERKKKKAKFKDYRHIGP